MAQEINTGIFFPSALSQDFHLKLVGVGVKRKIVFPIYAFGIYIDQKQALKSLALSWSHQSVESILNNSKFFESYLNDDFEKAIVLVMAKKVSGNLMSDIFNSLLMSRIQTIGLSETERSLSSKAHKYILKEELEPLVALESFKNMFFERKLKKSLKITFHWQKGKF